MICLQMMEVVKKKNHEPLRIKNTSAIFKPRPFASQMKNTVKSIPGNKKLQYD